METRTLGRTGVDVGCIGLGTEYLVAQPRETVVSVVRSAVQEGINYIDILFPYHDYLENMAAALEGIRDRVLITAHLGSGETKGQYRRTRDVKECTELFNDLLTRLKTDYVDVAFLSNCDTQDDYETVMGGNGLLGLGRSLQSQGKARFIAFSGHKVATSRKAVESEQIDVLMHNVNFTRDAEPGRKELYELCSARGIGLVAMKPFAGGSLLEKGKTPSLTPIQCITYAAAQPGVSVVLPGVKNTRELQAALDWMKASDEEKDFSGIIKSFQEVPEGICVYCNHCLPCPVGIDVGRTTRILSAARNGLTPALTEKYASLTVKASECTECGSCVGRCPFGVDIIANMKRTAALFESHA